MIYETKKKRSGHIHHRIGRSTFRERLPQTAPDHRPPLDWRPDALLTALVLTQVRSMLYQEVESPTRGWWPSSVDLALVARGSVPSPRRANRRCCVRLRSANTRWCIPPVVVGRRRSDNAKHLVVQFSGRGRGAVAR